MARRRVRTIIRRARGGFRRRGGARGMLGGASGLFKVAAAGVGGGMVAQEIANRAFPQAAPIAGLGGAYIAGGVKGLIAKVAYDAFTGQSGILGGLFGGGGGGAGNDSL